ncbi:DUF2382 domain-containing protein [Rhodopila sp.]|uniref:DUF2382 domain-containing protein n=1 Tax=Rhodopila sp. TaxID=2480087 RepID=UPI003D0E9C94
MASDEELKGDDAAIQLQTEDLSLSRRLVIGDTTRVNVVTREHDHQIDAELTNQTIEIDRISIGRVIDAVPPVRHEGDTTIVSIVEEILFVERRLMLKEEVRIRQVRTTQHHSETVVLREQDAEITRIGAGEREAAEDGCRLGIAPPHLHRNSKDE